MSEGTKRGRGRPPLTTEQKEAKKTAKKAPDKVPAADREVNGDHNNPKVAKEPLNEDQLQSLFFNHKKQYEKALAVKKKADADFKVVCKLLKAEGTKLSDVKLAIELEDPEASGEMRARLERELRVARWVGAPVGTQFSLLDEVDRTPIDERTFEDGKRAGLKGEPATPPKHTPGNLISHWMGGHHEGQTILAGRIKQQHDEQKSEDAKAFDDTLPSTATH